MSGHPGTEGVTDHYATYLIGLAPEMADRHRVVVRAPTVMTSIVKPT
jgi:hypothetical protein